MGSQTAVTPSLKEQVPKDEAPHDEGNKKGGSSLDAVGVSQVLVPATENIPSNSSAGAVGSSSDILLSTPTAVGGPFPKIEDAKNTSARYLGASKWEGKAHHGNVIEAQSGDEEHCDKSGKGKEKATIQPRDQKKDTPEEKPEDMSTRAQKQGQQRKEEGWRNDSLDNGRTHPADAPDEREKGKATNWQPNAEGPIGEQASRFKRDGSYPLEPLQGFENIE